MYESVKSKFLPRTKAQIMCEMAQYLRGQYSNCEVSMNVNESKTGFSYIP